MSVIILWTISLCLIFAQALFPLTCLWSCLLNLTNWLDHMFLSQFQQEQCWQQNFFNCCISIFLRIWTIHQFNTFPYSSNISQCHRLFQRTLQHLSQFSLFSATKLYFCYLFMSLLVIFVAHIRTSQLIHSLPFLYKCHSKIWKLH